VYFKLPYQNVFLIPSQCKEEIQAYLVSVLVPICPFLGPAPPTDSGINDAVMFTSKHSECDEKTQ